MVDKKNTSVSLYRQIVNEIISSIQEGSIGAGDPIPSLNTLRDRHQISRDTVLMAYNELKVRGIIDSSPGKGYFVSSSIVDVEKKVFLLLDENTSYKNELYQSLAGHCDGQARVEVFFHHQNPQVFKQLLQSYSGKFSDYVIIPVRDEECPDLLAEVSKKGRVYILDHAFQGEDFLYPSVCQNFEEDILNTLLEHRQHFKPYKKTLMILGEPSLHSEEAIISAMIEGFRRFAGQSGLRAEDLRALPREIRKGQCYILHSDTDLVELVGKAQEQQLEPGRDIGIISYNETPLKSVVDRGISTISTDFSEMGKLMAAMIRGELKGRIKNKFRLIQRQSF